MAAYNGSEHIEEQLASILTELKAHDEVVIVNDCSTDNTADIIGKIDDARIRLINSPHNVGYVRTFERALAEARGEYIFLSDQDDVWIPGRAELMIGAMRDQKLVVSNCKHIEGAPGPFHQIRLRAKDSSHTVRNILGILVGYRLHWGCAMAFRRPLLNQILPFPNYMSESHDQWIALVGIINRSVRYLEADTVLHRLHAENLTPTGIRSFSKILGARVVFMKNLLVATGRKSGNN
jgi:glycosyltransferase involved in cell wall biosynthesis